MNDKKNDICKKINNYIAKISEDKREESVSEHTYKVARLAEHNAPETLKSTAKLIALLHDAGKNCDEFYYYIKKNAEKTKSTKVSPVTHSSAGGIIVTDIAFKKS